MLERCSFGVSFPRSGSSSVPRNWLLQNHGLDDQGATHNGIGSTAARPEDRGASAYILEPPGGPIREAIPDALGWNRRQVILRAKPAETSTTGDRASHLILPRCGRSLTCRLPRDASLIQHSPHHGRQGLGSERLFEEVDTLVEPTGVDDGIPRVAGHVENRQIWHGGG